MQNILRRGLGRPIVLIAICVVASAATSATAAKLITGANIKDGSVTGADIKDGSLSTKDLGPSVTGRLIVGYAHVMADGTNVASGTSLPAGMHVTKAIGPGEYCVERGANVVHGMSVQPIYDAAQQGIGTVSSWVQTDILNCPAGTDYTILLLDGSGQRNITFDLLVW